MPNDRPHARLTISYQQGTLRICLVLLLLTINDVINLESASQRHSGVYMENGLDQSANHTSTTDEKLALKRETLKLLGLPGKSKSSIDKALMMKQSTFNFALNAYELKVKKPGKHVEPSEFDFTENDLRLIHQSNVITGFMAHQSRQEHKPDRANIIWFDVASIPAENQMIAAQLRLYRGPNPKNRNNRGAFTVTAYRVLRTNDRQIEMQLVDSANTTAGHEGWITLNVTTSLLHWMKHPGDNNGLHLSVHPIDNSFYEITPGDIGIVLVGGDAQHQPFLAGFFRNAEFGEQPRRVLSDASRV